MEKYLELLKESEWFVGIAQEDILFLIDCFKAGRKTYQAGDYINIATDYIHEVGFILEGRIHMISEDFWGKKFILTEYSAGAIFGEAHSLTPSEPLLFSIVAVEKTEVLYFDMNKVIAPCGRSCACHQQLFQNLLRIIARKKIYFLHKIEHMSRKMLREKIISYLSEQSKKSRSSAFDIPYNRQQMADYLGVDRSAMSAELSKMQKEGLIAYRFNHFELRREYWPSQ